MLSGLGLLVFVLSTYCEMVNNWVPG